MSRRKSAEQKRREGTYRADRDHDAQPTAVASPEPPDYLHPYAREVWERTVPILLERRVLTLGDREALIGFSTAAARHRQCEEALEDGVYYRADTGLWKAHPAATDQAKWSVDLRAWSKALGLTPSDRARVTEGAAAPEQEEEDPFEALLRNRPQARIAALRTGQIVPAGNGLYKRTATGETE